MRYMSTVGIYTHRRFQSVLSVAADRRHPLHDQIQPPVEEKKQVLNLMACFIEKKMTVL